MTVSPSSLLGLPDDNRLANAYFKEATRHLEDARLLHDGSRYAGAITSSMKAIELGLKSLLILEGTRSWVDLNKHEVFTKIIADQHLFRKIQDAIVTQDPTLIGEIRAIEKLVPQKQELGKLEIDVATNTEYPFFARNATPPPDFDLYFPGTYFSETMSKRHFKTARRLLVTLQTISTFINAWSIAICSDLPP